MVTRGDPVKGLNEARHRFTPGPLRGFRGKRDEEMIRAFGIVAIKLQTGGDVARLTTQASRGAHHLTSDFVHLGRRRNGFLFVLAACKEKGGRQKQTDRKEAGTQI